MSSSQPLWLQAVHKLERAVGSRVESVVRSDTYFDVTSKATRARRKATGAVEGVSRRGLHLLNLPAGSDVRRIREQLSRMERRLDHLSENVADMDEAGRRSPVD
jgi:hypothetical protein